MHPTWAGDLFHPRYYTRFDALDSPAVLLIPCFLLEDSIEGLSICKRQNSFFLGEKCT